MADILGMLDTILSAGREEDEAEERRQKRRRAKLQAKRRIARRGRRHDDLSRPLDADLVAVLESDDDAPQADE